MSGALFVKASTLEGERTSPLFVKAISQEGYRATTYNLTVAKTHTFFIGEEQIWVHNCGPDEILSKYPGSKRNGDTITTSDGKVFKDDGTGDFKLAGNKGVNLSEKTFNNLAFDPAKGKITQSSIEEVRTALAAEKAGLIGKTPPEVFPVVL